MDDVTRKNLTDSLMGISGPSKGSTDLDSIAAFVVELDALMSKHDVRLMLPIGLETVVVAGRRADESGPLTVTRAGPSGAAIGYEPTIECLRRQMERYKAGKRVEGSK